MDASDAFGVAVRTIGLLVSLLGIWNLLYALFVSLGAINDGDDRNKLGGYWSAAAWFLAGGGALMVGADAIVSLAYRG
jgi:hypothetical protein